MSTVLVLFSIPWQFQLYSQYFGCNSALQKTFPVLHVSPTTHQNRLKHGTVLRFCVVLSKLDVNSSGKHGSWSLHWLHSAHTVLLSDRFWAFEITFKRRSIWCPPSPRWRRIVALNRLVPHPVLSPSVREVPATSTHAAAASTHAAAASTHAAFVAPTCAICFPPQSGYLLQLSDCTRRRPSGSVGTKHFLGPPLPLGLYFSAGCISGHLHWWGTTFLDLHQRPLSLMPR